MTVHERARRADEILADRARGLRWATIASRHGVSQRQAQRIAQEALASCQSPLDEEPLELVRDLLDQYEAAVEEPALLSESTAHDGVKLGAIRARLDALVSRAELLMAVGVLPRNLGDLALVISAERTARTVLDVLERHDLATPELLEELAEALAPSRNGVASSN